METNIVLILGLSIGLAVFLALIFQILIKQEKQFLNTLPSLEEAQQQIAKAYPDFVDCFELTKKVTDTIHGNRGTSCYFYGDYLVCKGLGVSIRVRLGEEKMSKLVEGWASPQIITIRRKYDHKRNVFNST